MTYRLGTDEQQPATASADWYLKHKGLPRLVGRVDAALFPRWRGIGIFGARGDYPAGTGHAVPWDSGVALCGERPLHLWKGDFDPESRVVTPCQRCAQLA